ncbi:hemolysin III family protein [Salipaludibacillus sp. LMS25]|uniref:PAQR family membrane homeostasis protein TrhA n=1 Tax=Salipaludibacillus sp. LMS25 TaxID=2924031 RepID=UPI0020D1583E|nr:hemolysin III family protein [Salipaludibacillus sp. LMS25]UTR13293.1 hemolysin III family protein [Salipaludibacillus sp. LMS25]
MNAYIREPVNGLTHLAGALLSFVALLAMVMKVSVDGVSPLELMAVIIFGISLILLYSASATYHMVIAKDKVIAFFRRMDHSMIYVLIAGTYTPFCLITMNGIAGWTLFGVVTVLAIAGVVFKMVWFHSPRWLSTGLYIGMGWLVVFFFAPLSEVMAFPGLMLLLAGGILYTIGGVIYGWKPHWIEFKHIGYHEIFHIFILLGSLAHFLSVYLYVI